MYYLLRLVVLNADHIHNFFVPFLLQVGLFIATVLPVLRRYSRRGTYHSKKRLDGQTAFVTGGNTGLGYETSKDLCRRGARVVMLVQEAGMGRAAVHKIEEELKGDAKRGQIAMKTINLGNFAKIRQCANELREEETRLDLLVLNAGVCTFQN